MPGAQNKQSALPATREPLGTLYAVDTRRAVLMMTSWARTHVALPVRIDVYQLGGWRTDRTVVGLELSSGPTAHSVAPAVTVLLAPGREANLPSRQMWHVCCWLLRTATLTKCALVLAGGWCMAPRLTRLA